MTMSPALLQLHDLLHVTPTTSATSTKNQNARLPQQSHGREPYFLNITCTSFLGDFMASFSPHMHITQTHTKLITFKKLQRATGHPNTIIKCFVHSFSPGPGHSFR
jgi:hypothetical protein